MLERIAMCHLRHFESPSVRWQNPKNLGLKYDARNVRQQIKCTANKKKEQRSSQNQVIINSYSFER